MSDDFYNDHQASDKWNEQLEAGIYANDYLFYYAGKWDVFLILPEWH